MISGKNYKDNDTKTTHRSIPPVVINTILDLSVKDDETISVFLVQAPLSFVNFDTQSLINKLNLYKTKKNREAIDNIITLLTNSTIKPGGNNGRRSWFVSFRACIYKIK